MTTRTVKCVSCTAEIFFTLDVNTGRKCPIDAEPVPAGNIRIFDGNPPHSQVVGATVDLFDTTDDGVRYVSHFVTCPNAPDWRKHGRPMSAEQLATPGPKRWRTMHR